MKIFVTGGAGYIGSHLVKNLLKEGFFVVVLDNLSSGNISPIEILQREYDVRIEFIKSDLADKEKLAEIFKSRNIDAVMHLAAKIDVSESLQKPEMYHQENYINSINLLEAMTAAGVDKLIYSSTAAVYGNPEHTPIDENHPTNPMNPYAQTKLDFEKYLNQVENLKYIILRYFNVGGSDPVGLIGKSHIQSGDLLENIMKVALGKKEKIQIFGSDYDTPDGSAVRDFVHVEDVCQAHILALKRLNASNYSSSERSESRSIIEDSSRRARTISSGQIFNLGSEQGFSVKEIIDKASIIMDKDIPTETVERREGDIAVSVASAQKTREILGWNPQYSDLDSIIRTDWNWRRKHPMGYT